MWIINIGAHQLSCSIWDVEQGIKESPKCSTNWIGMEQEIHVSIDFINQQGGCTKIFARIWQDIRGVQWLRHWPSCWFHHGWLIGLWFD